MAGAQEETQDATGAVPAAAVTQNCRTQTQGPGPGLPCPVYLLTCPSEQACGKAAIPSFVPETRTPWLREAMQLAQSPRAGREKPSPGRMKCWADKAGGGHRTEGLWSTQHGSFS